jgi:hypothetical protein
MRSILALALLLLAALFTASRPARADGAESPSHDLAVSVGYSRSNISPSDGGLIAVAYAQTLSPRWSWLIRPELVLNLDRPDGRLSKGAAVGLDGGVAWASHPEGPRLLAEATVGARLLSWPGIGAVSRLAVGVGLPLAPSLSLAIGLSGELGLGKIGDERAQTRALLRADLWTRASYAF